MLRVELCQDPCGWDRFVESHADAYNYHRWGWRRVIEETYGHKPYYLVASEAGSLRGILPLFSIRSRLFGNSLVSVPFFSYGGVLANSPAAAEALLQKAGELASQTGARHVELRQAREFSHGWEQTRSKVTMEVLLPSTPDELWRRFSTGHRNKIRKSQKSGFRVEWGGAEAVRKFYPVFAANMRNLGTPVYPRKWFEVICERFPGEIQILTIHQESHVAAAAFLAPYRDTLEVPWSASLPDIRKQYSHYLMYWSFLEWAIQKGFRRMDLGRCTPGSGTYDFKCHWVCQEHPLDWYYWLAPGSAMPSVKNDSPRYHLAIQLWKHLPLAVANQLGPHIVRALP